MDKREDKYLAICATKKAPMPLIMERFTSPLQCNPVQEDFESFKKAIAETTELNVKLLTELPPPRNFSLDELVLFVRSKVKAELEKDRVFEKGVEIGKYAKSFHELMEKYFANIFALHKNLKNQHSEKIFELSKGFLNSDLPEGFLRTISTSFLVENDFIDLFDGRIKKERLALFAKRNNRIKFERLCNAHNYWAHDFGEKIDDVERNRTKLVWYVDINNSKTVEDCFNDKFIKTDVLDKELLAQLVHNLEQTTSELEVLVIKNSQFQCTPTNSMDDSMKAITAMMDILNH
jgi:hypothetical protein